MRKVLSLCLIVVAGLFSNGSFAQEEHGPTSDVPIPSAVKGQVYGQDIPEKNVVSAKAYEKKLNGENPVKMQVKGTVTGVCKARGCWVTVDIGKGKEVFVKMKDYGFFMPMDAKGKTVLLSGDAFVETTSVAELRDQAKEDNQSAEEIAKIKSPEKDLKFTAYGITILD